MRDERGRVKKAPQRRAERHQIVKSGGVSDENKRLGTGDHVDRAWAAVATIDAKGAVRVGDRRVMISVLDSGIEWEHRDLVNKWFLNAAELPPPDSGCPGSDGVKHD